MDHLLVVTLNEGVPESFLDSLRNAGWRISVTSDIVRAKHFLQKGDVAGVMIEFNPASSDPDRLKVLRFIREVSPGAMVIMLNSGAGAFEDAGSQLLQALNSSDEALPPAHPGMLELFNLSPAQKRIAELVAQAYPNREIARRLRIKEQSVRNELSRIFKKMGIWSRVELALLMRNGQQEAAEIRGATHYSPQALPAELKLPVQAPVSQPATSAR